MAWAAPEKVKRNFDLPNWAESPEIVVEVTAGASLTDGTSSVGFAESAPAPGAPTPT